MDSAQNQTLEKSQGGRQASYHRVVTRHRPVAHYSCIIVIINYPDEHAEQEEEPLKPDRMQDSGSARLLASYCVSLHQFGSVRLLVS